MRLGFSEHLKASYRANGCITGMSVVLLGAARAVAGVKNVSVVASMTILFEKLFIAIPVLSRLEK